jgi:hypothetical protein
VQVCPLAGAVVTLRFWTTVSDGRHQESFRTGVDEHGTSYAVASSLTKR